MKKQIEFFSCIFTVDRFYQERIQRNAMYRQFEDMEEIGRLDDERLRLLVENRELKIKLERKKDKIQDLKEEVERLTKALAQAQYGDCQYEKEQQELRRAELQNFQLAPFIDLPKEEESSSIPFDDIGERIIVRDGKQIKQVKHLRGFDGNGDEICFYQEWELTKRELEEIETEKRKIADTEAAKQCALISDRISEEEPSIPFDDVGERIIVRDGKTYKQWFELGFGTDILYREEEIVDE
jgi:hypothetical protein